MPTGRSDDRIVRNCLSFLPNVLETYTNPDFAVQFWDGTVWDANPGQPARFTLVLKHPGALRRMFWAPDQLSLGEAYIYDDFDILGEVEAAIRLALFLNGLRPGFLDRLRLARFLFSLPSARPEDSGRTARLRGARHSRDRDREAISYHYNVSNEFYRTWLDRGMVYSCAYFLSEAEDLDSAQERKLDIICRKLRLKRDERFLDIGCGWGGLIIHAARNYGVRAVGVTLSAQQADLARERIREAGVADRCRVELCDYRDLTEWGGFDKAASVGMFEHVGVDELARYFEQTSLLLRPGGVFLNHGIAQNPSHPQQPGPSFIKHYVFPDGELVPISTTLHEAELAGFEVRDVESLREHYRLTLLHWIRRLEAHHDEILRITDEVTFRIWRLYMAGFAHEFGSGQLNLYQTLLVKPDGGKSGMPLTRGDWYC
jgi:cyclopropane-fatty-acyl-phospholipid synthase